MKRRQLVLSGLPWGMGAVLGPLSALNSHAVQRKSLTDPLRLGVEQTLVDSGLAGQLQRSFGRDTGVAVQLVPGRSAVLLEALEQGELDAAMTDAPELELPLEKHGLAHDRRLIAQGDLVLVGPLEGKGKKAIDPAGVLREPDITVALAKLARTLPPTPVKFISAPFGSGSYLAELSLWRAAKVAPAAPWWIKSEAKADVVAQAAATGSYTLVERGLWLSRPPKGLAILVEGDARMAVPVHVMRAFRVNHPAAKLFVQWSSGAPGRRVVSSVRGWHAPAAR